MMVLNNFETFCKQMILLYVIDTKIESSINRICGVLYICDGSTILMINCSMPCDNYTEDENYTDTLNPISQRLYTHTPSHVIIGGDMNVDFNKSSPHTRILTNFIEDFTLYACTDLPNANVQYTYIKILMMSHLRLISFLLPSHYVA